MKLGITREGLFSSNECETGHIQSKTVFNLMSHIGYFITILFLFFLFSYEIDKN